MLSMDCERAASPKRNEIGFPEGYERHLRAVASKNQRLSHPDAHFRTRIARQRPRCDHWILQCDRWILQCDHWLLPMRPLEYAESAVLLHEATSRHLRDASRRVRTIHPALMHDSCLRIAEHVGSCLAELRSFSSCWFFRARPRPAPRTPRHDSQRRRRSTSPARPPPRRRRIRRLPSRGRSW